MEFTPISSSSLGNCYHVTDGETEILIECGISISKIRQALDFKLSKVDACLISHEHGDHAKHAKSLIKAGITIYTSQGTADAIKCGNVIKSGVQFNIGALTVMPFNTIHDANEPLGFLIADRDGDKLLFLTDSAYIPFRFKNLTMVAVECNYDDGILDKNIATGYVPASQKKRLINSHMSLDNVISFFAENDLKFIREIFLLHLSDRNSDDYFFKKKIQEVTGKPVKICSV